MRMGPQADETVLVFGEGQIAMTGVHVQFQIDAGSSVDYAKLKFARIAAQDLSGTVLP